MVAVLELPETRMPTKRDQDMIGERLKRLMDLYPVTQSDLAELLGVDKAAISRYVHRGARCGRTLILLLDRVEDELHVRYRNWEPDDT